MKHYALRAAWSCMLAATIVACGGQATDTTTPETTTGEVDAAPSDSAADTALSPEETIARMLELAQAGDWEGYVDDFYGEAHKFEGIAERRDQVVARFRDKWAGEVLDRLSNIDEGPAQISDDGKKAMFSIDGEPGFELHKEADGRWMFHL